ncbi:hypothetical protein [Solibacillus sp. FSL H8-0538]|uniref:hypothetical protein n=1 Tax=Solibacillus sp. FSL H8-0538 TaxID=2921400 RepID=UPI0030FCB8FF
MGIVNELFYDRQEALDRQKLLHNHRCVGCPYRLVDGYSEDCHRCPVKYELIEIGQVLNQTVKARVEVCEL